MAIHESSCGLPVPLKPCASTPLIRSITPADANVTMTAPEPLRNERREKPARVSARAASEVSVRRAASEVSVRVMPWLPSPRSSDRLEHAHVAEAAAQDPGERLLNLLVGGARVLVEERFGGEHHTAQTEAALRGLLVDEGLLNRMQFLRCAETLERGDLGARHRADRRDAGPDGLAVRDHRARAALAEAAAELGAAQFEVVAQDEQQRRGWIDVHGPRAPVHLQCQGGHGREDTAGDVVGGDACVALNTRAARRGIPRPYWARRFSMSGRAASTTSPTVWRLRALTNSSVSCGVCQVGLSRSMRSTDGTPARRNGMWSSSMVVSSLENVPE